MRSRVRSLAKFYTLWTAAIVTMAIVVSGGVQMWLLLRQTREAVEYHQALQALQVSTSIDRFLETVAAQLRAAVSHLDTGVVDENGVRGELARLLEQSHAIERATWFDSESNRRVTVSRADAPGAPVLAQADVELPGVADGRPYFGAVVFREGIEPSVMLSLEEVHPHGGSVAVQLNLEPVSTMLSSIRIGETGSAYVVDGDGNLLAHPDKGLVVSHTNWSGQPQVRAALQDAAYLAPGGGLTEWVDDDGRPVVSHAVRLALPDWVLITEQPRQEAYTPIRRSLAISLLLLAIAAAAGIAAGALLGARVQRPIRQLAEGARRIGLGHLDHRIAVERYDEIGQLARHFNRMAERLSESYATLEAKVRQRTAELARANGELQASKEEAERASLAKTRFLASASHDLRQPMHTLSLLVGVLEQRITYPEVSRIVANIQASSDAIENLLNSLLDISKLDAGTVKPAIRDCALGEILRLVALHYEWHASEKGLQLVVVPTKCVVRSDAALLERVVHNLVANAIRYTRSGKVLVGCRRHGDHVELQVWDTGIGIPAAHREEIFEEFFQLDNPERDRGKGLGLGLSIVKRTLDLLGHPIRVRSEPGRGSCFSIELPLVRLSRLSMPAAASPMRLDRIGGAFVLVIDDEAAARHAVEALCREWGAHTLSAASAEECIERLAQHLRLPDLILSDYRLRERRDGISAIERIRAYCEAPIPAIIVTGDISSEDLQRVAAAGLPVLHKPLSAERLLRAIDSALTPRPIEGCVGASGGTN